MQVSSVDSGSYNKIDMVPYIEEIYFSHFWNLKESIRKKVSTWPGSSEGSVSS